MSSPTDAAALRHRRFLRPLEFSAHRAGALWPAGAERRGRPALSLCHGVGAHGPCARVRWSRPPRTSWPPGSRSRQSAADPRIAGLHAPGRAGVGEPAQHLPLPALGADEIDQLGPKGCGIAQVVIAREKLAPQMPVPRPGALTEAPPGPPPAAHRQSRRGVRPDRSAQCRCAAPWACPCAWREAPDPPSFQPLQ